MADDVDDASDVSDTLEERMPGEVDTIVEKGREYVEIDGQRIEIVKTEGVAREPPKYSPGQRAMIGDIYVAIARQLPTEGRDYTVDFDFPDPNGPPRLSFKSYTRLGMAFVHHLAEALGGQGRQNGRETAAESPEPEEDSDGGQDEDVGFDD